MNKLLKNKSDIIKWLDKYKITNYELILDNKYGYTAHVDGDVVLNEKRISFIPIKFSNVSGYFSCNHNNLTSLEFSPEIIGGSFYCHNNKLTNLQFCPHTVNGSFYCNNNNLTSLQFCPTTIDGIFVCHNNQIANLTHFPSHISGYIYLGNNNLTKIDMDKNKTYNFAELYPIHLEHKIKAEKEKLNNSISETIESSPKGALNHRTNQLKI